MNVRQELERLMLATIQDRHNWTYRAIRPMPVPATWKPGQHVTADCSKGVQFLCAWAHAPDPMGNDWDVWGNSTTIAAHLEHVLTPISLRPGDIVTFGPNGSLHAAMVLAPGIDPLLWSHGHQGAPNTYKLSQDAREHQLLRLPLALNDPPTKAALRARKGYWAWLTWTLGEGDWKPYGAWNKDVRPNVDRWIGLKKETRGWWQLRLEFLRARAKGNPAKGPL